MIWLTIRTADHGGEREHSAKSVDQRLHKFIQVAVICKAKDQILFRITLIGLCGLTARIWFYIVAQSAPPTVHWPAMPAAVNEDLVPCPSVDVGRCWLSPSPKVVWV